jgi:hypothetical protein
MPVILVNKVVGAEEEEWHKGVADPPKILSLYFVKNNPIF